MPGAVSAMWMWQAVAIPSSGIAPISPVMPASCAIARFRLAFSAPPLSWT
eukprot:COSAG04_NODE_24743_length_317_cov_1.064220_1_plen_49_part_10